VPAEEASVPADDTAIPAEEAVFPATETASPTLEAAVPVEEVAASPLNGSGPSIRPEVLESAGLELVETRSNVGAPKVEEPPVRLGRVRKPRNTASAEPLQQVETQDSSN